MGKRKIIEANEHVFVAGKTGTGKTWLTRKYLAGYENVVLLDTKGTTNWTEAGDDLTTITRLSQIDRVETPKIRYKPTWDEMNEEYYNAFFKWVYQRQNTIVWIDEVMSICPNPHKMPEFYRACLTRGRELGIGCWSLSQCPNSIPQLVMSEATHFIVFDLNLPQDRGKIVDITGMAEFAAKPGKYQFWYHHVETDTVHKAKGVERR